MTVGADRWILHPRYPRASRRWWGEALWGIPKRFTLHKWERLTRGFSRYDMLNGDLYLVDIIAATAYWHFAHSRGHPAGMTHEEWLGILLEIRDGFTAEDEDGFPAGMAWDLLRKHLEGMGLMDDDYDDLDGRGGEVRDIGCGFGVMALRDHGFSLVIAAGESDVGIFMLTEVQARALAAMLTAVLD